MKNQISDFLLGTAGSAFTFLQAQPAVDPILSDQDKHTLILSIVSIVGGIITTVVTKLLKKLFKTDDSDTQNSKKHF